MVPCSIEWSLMVLFSPVWSFMVPMVMVMNCPDSHVWSYGICGYGPVWTGCLLGAKAYLGLVRVS